MSTILLLTHDVDGNGSVASVVRNHARLLAARHRVLVVSRPCSPASIPSAETYAAGSPDFIWARRYGHVMRDAVFVHKCLGVSSRICESVAVDVVVAHSHALSAIVGARLAERFGAKSVLVAHADIHDRPAGTYDPLLTRWYRYVTPIAYRKAHLVVAVSAQIANAAVAHGGAIDRTCVIPNGIDVDEVGALDDSSTELRAPTDPVFRLLYVGRLSPEKGVEHLLRAVALLRDKGFDMAVRIVGDGPLRGELERLAGRLELDGLVCFEGAQPRNRLAAWYRSAHVVCVPSISEPQGIVVLEALACGTPVVASSVGGIPEMVVDGLNGRLVRPASPLELAKAIWELGSNREAWAAMAGATVSSVRERWSWAAIGQRWFRILGDVIAT